MRNHLHGFTQIISASFLQNHRLVHLTAGEIVVPRENAIREALVVAEVEIGFCAVVQDVDLAVLEGIHRAGIHVQIRIKFLENNTQTTCFEQRSKRRGGQSFAKGTNHPASDKNVFHEGILRFARASFCSSAVASSGVSMPGDPVAVTST